MQKPIPQFHPIQKFRHLMNRLQTNSNYRDSAIAKLQTLEKEYQKQKKDIELEINDCVIRRTALLEESRQLLPELRGFGKSYEVLKNILQ